MIASLAAHLLSLSLFSGPLARSFPVWYIRFMLGAPFCPGEDGRISSEETETSKAWWGATGTAEQVHQPASGGFRVPAGGQGRRGDRDGAAVPWGHVYGPAVVPHLRSR
jgi:hypothetical protein